MICFYSPPQSAPIVIDQALQCGGLLVVPMGRGSYSDRTQ